MDERKVRGWRHFPNAKTDKRKPPEFLKEYGDVLGGLSAWMASASLYKASNWLLHQHVWLNQSKSVTGVGPSEVVDVELGYNFGEEFSFRHPCFVLNKLGSLLTVVPLTSKANGKGIVVDATGATSGPSDPDPVFSYRVEFLPIGAAAHSVLLVDQVRTVSEVRILGKRPDIVVPSVVSRVVQERLTLLAAPDFHGQYTNVRRSRNKYLKKVTESKVAVEKANAKLALLNEQVTTLQEKVATLEIEKSELTLKLFEATGKLDNPPAS